MAQGNQLGLQFSLADLEATLETGEPSDFELEVVTGGTGDAPGTRKTAG